jgi:hypothetical protein
MILVPVLIATALAPAAGNWSKPLWDSAPATLEGGHGRPAWWGSQCAESHPTLLWNWLDAIRSEEGLDPQLPELTGATVARFLPRLAPSTQLGNVNKDGQETWGGAPLLAMHGVLDLCYVELVTMVEAVGSGAQAFEELGLETRGQGTLEVRHGYDLMLRPSRFVWASAARGLDAAAVGVGGTVGMAVAAPGGEATQWLVRPMRSIEVGPRFLWDASSWLALTVDVNVVFEGPNAAWQELRDNTRAPAPGLKVLMGAILRAPEEPLVEFFKTH